MKSRTCARCGENLIEKDGILTCRYCGATYTVEDEPQKMEELLEAKKQELLANRRRVLWQEAHRPNPSKDAIVRAANDVRSLLDEDDLATFYALIHQQDLEPLRQFYETRKVPSPVAKEIVRFSIPSLKAKMTLPLKSFVERHFKGDDYFTYMSQIEAEAERLEDGLYMTSLPRDVFLAYSSKDMPKVVEFADFLEGEGFSVFCALRNLRHGAGSAEFYLDGLHDAMKHCKAFVFLSSKNSRTTECDALKEEIPYVLDNLPNIKRIHYRLDEEGKTGVAAGILLKEFDDGREWCRSKEDLVARLLARDKKIVGEEEEEEDDSGYPYKSEYDDDGYLVIHENQENVTSEYGSLLSYDGLAKKIRLGEDFTSVGKQAFKNDYNLEEIDLGKGVKTLSSMAFNGAKFLERVHGGDYVDMIGEGVFAGTPRLKSVDNPKSGVYRTNDSGMVIEVARNKVLRYLGSAKVLGESDFEGVEEIDAGAFAFCDSLERVTIPDSVMDIGKGAFAGCKNLRSVHLDKGILVVDKNAFAQCPVLTVYVNAPKEPGGWDAGYAPNVDIVYSRI